MSEGRVRTFLGYLMLLAVPPMLMVVLLATRFPGLQSDTALDHAQLARHIAGGDGFVTSYIRPLSLVFKAEMANHPDLYNAPLHPLTLALFYSVVHPSERVTAGTGIVLWIASVWLTFLIARKWWDAGVAGLAAVFYGCSVGAAMLALGGLPQPLMAIFALAAVWAAFPSLEENEEGLMPEIPAWRIIFAGTACSLAFLTGYVMIVLALVMGTYLVATRHRKTRCLALFLGGFLLPLLPWLWRNFQLTRAPLFSLYWYELLAGTGTYPGESIWRTLAPSSLLVFLVQHPLQMLRKLLVGFAQARGTVVSNVDPVVGFLFLASLFSAMGGRQWRGLTAVVAGGLALGMAASCFVQSDTGFLMAWLPLVALLAAARLGSWIKHHVSRITFEGLRITLPRSKTARRRREPPHRIFFGRLSVPPLWSRAGAYAIVIGFVVFPLTYLLVVSRPLPGPRIVERVRPLAFWLRADATVMTDQPALVAWHAERNAVWLCQHEEELAQMESVLGPVGAVFVTPVVMQMTAAERGDWWSWIVAPRGIYRGLAPSNRMPPNTMLRVRAGAVSQ